jgi:V/A-type H+-transporting ATPase subunit I
MIVPMKKVFIIVREKEAAPTLDRIASLGVLHVNHLNPPQGSHLERLKERLSLIDQAIGILRTEGGAKTAGNLVEEDDPLTVANTVSELKHKNKQLQEEASSLMGEIAHWEKWGDFSPQSISAFGGKHLIVRLYLLKQEELALIPDDAITRVIFREGPLFGCAVVAQRPFNLPFPDLGMPSASLSELRIRLEQTKRRIEDNTNKIRNAYSRIPSLNYLKSKMIKDLELAEAVSGMGKYGPLAVISGYMPQDHIQSLRKAAEENQWGFLATAPADDDEVPTLLANNRLINIMRPLFRFIELIPGYRELDMSPVFFIFFSLFVALLVNDFGYGLIFFGLTSLAQKKWGESVSDHTVFHFFYFMSAVIAVMGILSGTYFGQDWLPAWVQPVIPALRNATDVQMLCFLIGATHLTIGHVWQMVLKWPSPGLLVDIGWIAILWCCVFVANTLILGKPLSPYILYLFIFGTGMILFFTQTQKSLLRNFGEGLGNYALNLMNNFTDIVSYIRLFAVGLAGVSVANAFNLMATGIGFDGVVPALMASFILLFGHSLNIILSPMSILVHGVRLNVLEFSAHVDVKWSGVSYKPLKKGAEIWIQE